MTDGAVRFLKDTANLDTVALLLTPNDVLLIPDSAHWDRRWRGRPRRERDAEAEHAPRQPLRGVRPRDPREWGLDRGGARPDNAPAEEAPGDGAPAPGS